MTTEQRFEKLEHELAGAKRRNRWMLGAAFLVLGGLITAGNIRPPAEEVKARRFVVVDAEGKTRATLGVDENGTPMLFMSDPQGKNRAMLVVADGSPGLVMSDAQGETMLDSRSLSMRDAQENLIWSAP